ncbi:protein phosphatase 1 regulatory subunit 3B [Caerostris extrusa]|uniref:Protein phosphatase 1 regulatory subunit 3B n=1 Tax=Caerostris extrusa TaxID=172846 RepID=A0AAV4WX19_CAEEX|nr:protein phosphatase 1 regulatory subunit 3B [Caerostris extrusa]
MPMDLEMLLSATRSQLFPYTQFGDDRFSLAGGYGNNRYSTSLSFAKDPFLVNKKSRRFGIIQDRPIFTSTYKVETDLESKKEESSAPQEVPEGGRKKKVSFADDKGLELVEVREIPGAQKWNNEVLTLLVSGSQKNSANEKVWKLAPQHSPRKEAELLELVEASNIVLESVNIKKTFPNELNGTIKVKNLAYEKNVFIRISFDRWMSHVDVKATYVKSLKNQSKKMGHYDTFSFRAEISPSAVRYGVIEFCVCLQCNGQNYWDNNGGINYRLIVDSSKQNSVPGHEKSDKITLSLTENIENFSEIDAWSNLMCNQPYW